MGAMTPIEILTEDRDEWKRRATKEHDARMASDLLVYQHGIRAKELEAALDTMSEDRVREIKRAEKAEEDLAQANSRIDRLAEACGKTRLRAEKAEAELAKATLRIERMAMRAGEAEGRVRELEDAANDVDRAQWKSRAEQVHALANLATVLERKCAPSVSEVQVLPNSFTTGNPNQSTPPWTSDASPWRSTSDILTDVNEREALERKNKPPAIGSEVYLRARRKGTVVAVNESDTSPLGPAVQVQWGPEGESRIYYQFNRPRDLEPVEHRPNEAPWQTAMRRATEGDRSSEAPKPPGQTHPTCNDCFEAGRTFEIRNRTETAVHRAVARLRKHAAALERDADNLRLRERAEAFSEAADMIETPGDET